MALGDFSQPVASTGRSEYEDQQKMAESLNRRKSIFLSHYECMRVAPLVR
eukprot:COSAG01_NODE_50059_length_366_cov_3.576779_1_plen_49_part_10